MPSWGSDDLLVTGFVSGIADRVRLWSIPEGVEIGTVDFGAPSWWRANLGRLFSVTVPAELEEPRISLLRSWDLPRGENRPLGRFDWTTIGARYVETRIGVGGLWRLVL
jgi:hypothetical protein